MRADRLIRMLLALPPALAQTAAELDSWFLHNPIGPRDDGPTDEQLRLRARAIQAGVEVRVRPEGSSSEVSSAEGSGARSSPALGASAQVFRPLGLILDSGAWHLVLAADGAKLQPLVGLTGRLTLGRRFTKPADFDLTSLALGEVAVLRPVGRWRVRWR